MSMEQELAREQFAHHVQRALFTLYDPALLSNSLLISLFDVQGHTDPAAAMGRAAGVSTRCSAAVTPSN